MVVNDPSVMARLVGDERIESDQGEKEHELPQDGNAPFRLLPPSPAVPRADKQRP